MATEGNAKTIDQLPEKTSILSSDMFPLDDGAQTYRVLWSTILKSAGGIKTVTNSGSSITITLNDGTSFTITTSDPNKQDKLTWDTAPTSGSTNPVTSGGIYTSIEAVKTDLSATDNRIAANATAISEETNRAKQAEEANADAIETLNGDKTTEGSVAYQVAEAIAEVVANAPESLDTLKEIATWIEDHAGSAAEMNADIQANTKAIEAEAKTARAAEKAITDQLDALGFFVDDEGYICQE